MVPNALGHRNTLCKECYLESFTTVIMKYSSPGRESAKIWCSPHIQTRLRNAGDWIHSKSEGRLSWPAESQVDVFFPHSPKRGPKGPLSKGRFLFHHTGKLPKSSHKMDLTIKLCMDFKILQQTVFEFPTSTNFLKYSCVCLIHVTFIIILILLLLLSCEFMWGKF